MSNTVAPEKNEPEIEKTQSQLVDGRYSNPFKTYTGLPQAWEFVKWQCKSGFKAMARIPDEAELRSTLPVHKPKFDILQKPDMNKLYCTWIGHASVLVQMDGINLLTDPIFSDRCSPSSYFGPKRYRHVPCSIEELPNIDAVVISHNHYDHLDVESVRRLEDRFHCHWFVPMGVKSWMLDMGCKNVEECQWWQEKEVKGVKFHFTPAQHWSARGLFDRFKTLWGSWSIIGPKHKVFFAGDTGYCEAFASIGKEFGGFDVALIPIGAYCPRHIMQSQHVDPEEAVKIHNDVQAKVSIGVHWGTFNLSGESYLEPRETILDLVTQKKLTCGNFITLQHGQTMVLEEGGKVDYHPPTLSTSFDG